MDPEPDDTVTLPPRPREGIIELTPDLDETITLQRPAPSPAAPLEPLELAQPVESVELVEPPVPGSAVFDIGGNTTGDNTVGENIWSAPVPHPLRPFRVRLDDGTLVPLDEPVYLGRRPSVPRIHPGGIPLLVTLDSPDREVSSTHLQLTTVGGAIVATDMRSTNGSVVRVPGAAPHTLLGGESTVVTPGTVIELGDGNLIELLGPDHDREDGS